MTDQPASQCHSQADCVARGGDFADTTCSPERVCVKIAVQAQACATNAECIERAGGAPARCRTSDHACTLLTSPECARVFADKDDLLNDEAIYIGGTTVENVDGLFFESSVELARGEIKQSLGGGLPNPDPAKPKRPLVIIDCNVEPFQGLSSVAAVDRAYQHLIHTVEVPAVLGPFTTGLVLREEQEMIRQNVFSMTHNPIPQLTQLAATSNGLLYRAGFSNSLNVAAVNPVINDFLEAKIRNDFPAIPAGQPFRIVALSVNESQGTSLYPSIADMLKTLKWNGGKTIDENLAIDPNAFKIEQLGDSIDLVSNPNPTPEVNRAIADMANFAPQLIIHAGPPNPPLYVGLMKTLTAKGVPMPYFMNLIGGWQNFIVPVMAQAGGVANPLIRQRYIGLRAVGYNFQQADFDSWLLNLRFKFPELQNQTVGTNHTANYDGLYMIAYAIQALGKEAVTGPAIGRAMRKIASETGGVDVKWGPDGVATALAAIAKGDNLNYIGVLGPFLFDKDGDHPGDVEAYCITADTNNVPNKIIQSGYRYDSRAGKGTGTYVCP